MAAKPRAKPTPMLFGKQESLPSCFMRKEEDSGIEGLTCPVCCDFYSTQDNIKSPRILSNCGHTLCSACINDWSKIHDNMRRVSCPICCTNTNLPNDSVDDLPKNFAILDVIAGTKKKHPSFSSMSHFNSEASIEDIFCNAGCAEEGDILTPAKVYCFNCCMYMCNKCNDTLHCKGSALESHEIKTVAELQRHFFHQSPVRDSVFSTIRSNSDGSLCYCKIHREPLKIYCQTDNTAICIYCQLHGKHKGHECVMIEEMASVKREALYNLKEELKIKQGQCVVGFNSCKKVEEDLHETAVRIKAELDIHFKMLHSTLDARKNELLADLTEQIERKETILKAQTSTLSDAVGDLKTNIAEIELFCTSDHFEVFQKGDGMCKTAQDALADQYNHHPLVSSGAMLNFDDQSTLVSSIMAYGSVQTAPGRVRDLKLQVKDEKRTSLLTWKKPSNGGKPDTYKVEYSADDRKFKPVHSGPELFCQLHGSLSSKFSHKYRVAAENRAGCGPYSPPLPVKTNDASFHWDATRKSPCIVLTNDNLTAAVGDHLTGFVSIGGSRVFTTGQHYWEISLDRFGFQSSFRKVIAGVVSADAAEWERSHTFISTRCCPLCKQFWAVACGTGKKLSHQTPRRGSTYLRGDHFSEHDRLGILLDLEKHTLEFYRNGNSIGLAFDDVVGPVIPMVSMRFQKTVTLNFPPIPEVTSDYIVIA